MDEEELVPKKPSIPARTAKCITGTPRWCVECWLSCVVEMRDTVVYFARCCLHGPPSMVRGCVESIRKLGEDPKGELKSCCAPSPGCCGHTHPNGHFHICYNKPIDWGALPPACSPPLPLASLPWRHRRLTPRERC